jgi:trimethylamine--corrinoid protein Co-methyltransferase
MKMNRIKVLSKDDIQLIHTSTMELLSRVGIKVDDKEVRNLFQRNGAEVIKDFVKIPESLINKMLKKVPKSFKLHGPDGSYNFVVNLNSTHFSTIGTPVKIYDPISEKGVRKTFLADVVKGIRIVDSLKNIVSTQDDITPNDLPYKTLHGYLIREWAKNSRKSYGFGAYGKVVSQDIMNLASLIVGGEEDLIKRPRLIGFFNPTSPLRLPQIMTNGLSIFTKYKQPTIIASEAIAGMTSPVTLAGLLTQTNAEIIGGIILSQLFNPGAPIFYGTVSHITDMRTGNSAMGSAEMGLITIGIAQLAQFYNIPSRGPGAVTDSKVLDIQNGVERLQTLMLAAQAGINFITCAGSYEATLAEALELLVIDDELVGMVKRVLEGVKVNEDTIGLEVIKKVATSDSKGIYFLTEGHTRIHMKNELFFPKLADRLRRDTWQKKGAKDIICKAKEKIEEILKTQKGPGISADLEERINNYIKKMASRSEEEYYKTEGLR